MPARTSRLAEVHGFALADLDAVLMALMREQTKQGLASKEIAKRMGVSPSVVSRLANGRSNRKPSFALLQRYAAALGVELRLVIAASDGRTII